MQSYTLFQLNEYIRRILALNFFEPLWITAEIAQVGRSRGHFFLSLVQKEEQGDQILAQSEAALWEPTYKQLKKQLGFNPEELLHAGRLVKLRVQVDFHERYGLKLIIHEIDPAYTLGQLELQRRQTIQALQKARLLDRNAQLTLPQVVQRLAVISSETAAGYQDFMQQLAHNPYGYAFHIRFFPSVMQGQQVAIELPAQINKINRAYRQFDAVVVIRGGGARLDLSAFDEAAVAESLAKCRLPVITGIGHEIDETVADLVAHTALKTPTAVAEWLIGRAIQFESRLLQATQQLQLATRRQLQQEHLRLNDSTQQLRHLSRGLLRQQNQLLDFIMEELPFRAKMQARSSQQQLDQLAQMIRLLSVESTLKRGYTLTRLNGQSVHTAADVNAGDEITTIFGDGTVQSIVKDKQ